VRRDGPSFLEAVGEDRRGNSTACNSGLSNFQWMFWGRVYVIGIHSAWQSSGCGDTYCVCFIFVWFCPETIHTASGNCITFLWEVTSSPALFFFSFFFYYSYVHTRLGSFLPLAPTPSLTTYSTPSRSPPQYPAETILPLSLILL
jgi:hypothetical protein